jgi:hypothetical protein
LRIQRKTQTPRLMTEARSCVFILS